MPNKAKTAQVKIKQNLAKIKSKSIFQGENKNGSSDNIIISSKAILWVRQNRKSF